MPPKYDYKRLAATLNKEIDDRSWGPTAVRQAGGPSQPILKEMREATWRSSQPQGALRKLDTAFGKPDGYFLRILTNRQAPNSSGPSLRNDLSKQVLQEIPRMNREELAAILDAVSHEAVSRLGELAEEEVR